jgi:hypothetical protein
MTTPHKLIRSICQLEMNLGMNCIHMSGPTDNSQYVFWPTLDRLYQQQAKSNISQFLICKTFSIMVMVLVHIHTPILNF